MLGSEHSRAPGSGNFSRPDAALGIHSRTPGFASIQEKNLCETTLFWDPSPPPVPTDPEAHPAFPIPDIPVFPSSQALTPHSLPTFPGMLPIPLPSLRPLGATPGFFFWESEPDKFGSSGSFSSPVLFLGNSGPDPIPASPRETFLAFLCSGKGGKTRMSRKNGSSPKNLGIFFQLQGMEKWEVRECPQIPFVGKLRDKIPALLAGILSLEAGNLRNSSFSLGFCPLAHQGRCPWRSRIPRKLLRIPGSALGWDFGIPGSFSGWDFGIQQQSNPRESDPVLPQHPTKFLHWNPEPWDQLGAEFRDQGPAPSWDGDGNPWDFLDFRDFGLSCPP